MFNELKASLKESSKPEGELSQEELDLLDEMDDEQEMDTLNDDDETLDVSFMDEEDEDLVVEGTSDNLPVKTGDEATKSLNESTDVETATVEILSESALHDIFVI